MPISLIVGNGFTLDATKHCNLDISPNNPWSWDIASPYDKTKPLIDLFPRLKEHLKGFDNLSALGVYGAIRSVVFETYSEPVFKPNETATNNDYIHLEACHYLRFSYAWFSEQLSTSCLSNWQWVYWLKNNTIHLETILSYNYDTVLEKILRMCSIGKVYGSSRQNPFIGNGFVPLEPEIYWDEKKGDIKVVHIAKPHGSCNFTGVGHRQVTDSDGIKKPLYPIEDIFMLRDNTIKVLSDSEIYTPTHTADLVLPGEWPCWNKKQSTAVAWASEQKSHFINESRHADILVVAGFGFSEPDREEFSEIVERLPTFNKVIVINPNPPQELNACLQEISRGDVEVYNTPV